MNYNGKRAQKHVLRRPREKELKIISKNPYIKKKISSTISIQNY